MAQIVGGLTPLTNIPSNVVVLGGKPSTGDATKKDFVAIAGTVFASASALADEVTARTTAVGAEATARATALTTAINAEVAARNSAISAALSGGSGSSTTVVDATLTTSGAVNPAHSFVLLNGANLAMTLAAASGARGVLLVKNIHTTKATLAGAIEDISATFDVNPRATVGLAWVAGRSTWEIIGQYDPGALITDFTAATLASGTLLPAYDPDGTSKKTTAGALATFIGSTSYTLPTATTSVLGGVKVDGSTITISAGVISAAGGGGGGGAAAATFTPYAATVSGDVGTSATYARGDHAHPASAKIFNIGVTQPGKPADAQKLLVYKTNDVVTLPSGLSTSSATALVAATASSAFVLAYTRSGTTTAIATFTFAGSGTVATISGVTIPTLQVGDVLTITGPTTADATLADIGFSIVGTRA